jgi:hypothetical protein
MLLSVLSVASCNNDDDNNQILPPATQTGAGTFACTVNGQNFIDTSGGFFNCFYQLVDGEYYFGISAEDNDIEPFSINLGSFKREIAEFELITLKSYEEGNAFGGVFLVTLFLQDQVAIQQQIIWEN